MAIFDTLGKYRNTGLLIIRLGLGAMMMVHGFPKLAGGPSVWEGLGGSMKLVHIDFLPVFWGFMAAVAEGIGGLFLILGIFFRPTNMLLFFTMVIAALVHLTNAKEGIAEASHAIELGVVFLGLILLGPGKYSVDKK